MNELLTRADANGLFDRARYEAYYFGNVIGSLGRGLGRIFNGDRLDISADRWFWGPSRVYAELPPSGWQGGAITEMPYFTYIYGDLHAHMISMPQQLFGMLFILHEVVTAISTRRRTRWLALVLGGIAIGMLRATNTWDWITYSGARGRRKKFRVGDASACSHCAVQPPHCSRRGRSAGLWWSVLRTSHI
ncbi:MAG: DUF2298 domain-containing protein [Anaerolineae bacterium]